MLYVFQWSPLLLVTSPVRLLGLHLIEQRATYLRLSVLLLIAEEVMCG
jgi:hypothetical protein